MVATFSYKARLYWYETFTLRCCCMTRSLLSATALVLTALPILAQGPGGPMEHGPGGYGPMRTPVTNAPYSATFTSTSTEKLQDGTVLTRTDTRTASRDSMGRTREEVTFPAHGDEPAHTSITIFDPVAKTVTQLHPDEKTAVVRALRTPPAPPTGTAAPSSTDATRGPREDKNAVKTDLGSKTIDGDVASGTRVTRTIPAGSMGNATALVSTNERWMSTDLKIELTQSGNDPFHGTRTMAVSGLNRAEPDPALFAVPSGYTVKQATEHAGGRHGGGPRGGHVPPSPEGAPPAPGM